MLKCVGKQLDMHMADQMPDQSLWVLIAVLKRLTWTVYRLLMDQHLASTSGRTWADSQKMHQNPTFTNVPVLLREYLFLITTSLEITSIVSLETLANIMNTNGT